MKRRNEVSLFEMLREPRHKERDSGASGVEGIRLDRGASPKESSKPPADDSSKEAKPRRWFGRRSEADDSGPETPRSVPIAIADDLVVSTVAKTVPPATAEPRRAPTTSKPATPKRDVREAPAPIAVVDVPRPAEPAPRAEPSLPAFEPAHADHAQLSPRWVQWLNTGERLRRATLIVLGLGWLATVYVAFSAGTGSPSDEYDGREIVALGDADWARSQAIPVFKEPIRNVVPSGPTITTGAGRSESTAGDSVQPQWDDGEGYVVQCLLGTYDDKTGWQFLTDLEKQGARLEADLPGLETKVLKSGLDGILVVGFFDSHQEASSARDRVVAKYKGEKSYPGRLFRDAYVRKYTKDGN